jgi:hypothetical protein
VQGSQAHGTKRRMTDREENPDIPTYQEVMRMLAEKAKTGSVSAMIALERALRTEAEHQDLERELQDLIRTK